MNMNVTWWTGARWWICAEAMLDIFNKKYTASETVTSMLFYGAISTAAIAAWSWDSGQKWSTVHGCLNCADGSAVGNLAQAVRAIPHWVPVTTSQFALIGCLGVGANFLLRPECIAYCFRVVLLLTRILNHCSFGDISWRFFFGGASFCNPFALFSLFSTPSRYCLLKAWENLGVRDMTPFGKSRRSWDLMDSTALTSDCYSCNVVSKMSSLVITSIHLASLVIFWSSTLRDPQRRSSTLMPLQLARHDLSHLNHTLKHLRQPGNIQCVNFVKSLEICDGIGVLNGFMKFHVWFHGSICGRMHCRFYSSFQVSVHWVCALSLGCLAQHGDSFNVPMMEWIFRKYVERIRNLPRRTRNYKKTGTGTYIYLSMI